MARRIFWHVGTTKSGTTFLQRVLWAHHDELREHGLLLPGERSGDHFAAALDVREEPHRTSDPERVHGAWQRLVDEMAAWDGDALVTHELFAPATTEQARRAADALGEALGEAELHVVVTARDLARQVPSEWQEHLKHRSVLDFPAFVAEARTDPRGPFSPNGYHLWDEQDVAELLRRWAVVPPARAHVVTVPPRGAAPGALWSRFAGLLGVESVDVDLDAARSNSSLGAEQAELVRRVNEVLGDRVPLPGPYSTVVKGVLAHRHLARRPGTAYALTGDDHAWAVSRAQALVEELERDGVDVVGDLADLVPTDEPAPEVSGDAAVTTEAVLDEAVEAVAVLLERLAGAQERNQRLRARLTGRRKQATDVRGDGRSC